MMRQFTLAELAAACGASCNNASAMHGRIRIDSRQIQAGDIFVALQGERVDGHDFLVDAEKAGAVAAIVTRSAADCPLLQWQVPDTTRALGQIAAFNRSFFKGPVIGITGSVGKTTTKEMTAAILARQGTPLVTEGNLNNHLGVPLTLLRLAPQHDSAVIEMGASAVGEIRYLTGLARPDVALVTAVAPAHVEGFGSLENVAQGKAEIFEGLAENGTAIINLDNAHTASWVDTLSARFRLLRYSIEHSDADVFATGIQPGPAGMRFDLHILGESWPVSLSFLGRHNVGNAVAAAACGLAAGVAVRDIVAGLECARPYKGRLDPRRSASGALVIDDSYNANPASVKMAIHALLATEAEQKILVLGDMAELGHDAQTMHRDIGVYAQQAGVKVLLCCGELSRSTVEGFGKGARHFASQADLAEACLALAGGQTVFLVKGSRSAAMDRVADALVAGQARGKVANQARHEHDSGRQQQC